MRKYYDPEKVAKNVPFEPIPGEVRIAYLRPGELFHIQSKFPVAYQPIGTIEWHGRQNPLGCDTIKAERLCVEAAKRAGGVVMPPIYFAADAVRDLGSGLGRGMDATAGFNLPGSLYQIPDAQLKELLKNACANYLARGFRLVIIVSGHNAIAQQYLFDELCYEMMSPEGDQPVCFTMEYAVIEPGDPHRHSDNAGFYETSMMMHLTDLVNSRANDGCDVPLLAINTGRPLDEASAELGAEYFGLQIEGLARYASEKMAKLG